MFICGGTFVGLDNIISRRNGRKTIGFGSKTQADQNRDLGDLLDQVTSDDILEFGMIPEFVGRLPIVCPLMPLDVDALVRIMTEPRNALVKQYKKFFEMEGAELEFTDDSLAEIAKKAKTKDTGAAAYGRSSKTSCLKLCSSFPIKPRRRNISSPPRSSARSAACSSPLRSPAAPAPPPTTPSKSERKNETREGAPAFIASFQDRGPSSMSTVENIETNLPSADRSRRAARSSYVSTNVMRRCPLDIKAELIGGIVYLASPVSSGHSRSDGIAADWLAHYRIHTRGLDKLHNATVMFGDYGEPQPDCLLRIPETAGGRSRDIDNYIVGPPELIVEVSKLTRGIDLGPKKLDYERAGVLEYLFVGIDPKEVVWFVRRGERFEEMSPGEDGIIRSETFPGLWLDPIALVAGDLDRLNQCLGIKAWRRPEHVGVRRAAANRWSHKMSTVEQSKRIFSSSLDRRRAT